MYMKKLLLALMALMSVSAAAVADNKTYRISTDKTELVLQVGDNGRLYQTYLGKKLKFADEASKISYRVGAGRVGANNVAGWEVYQCSGAEDYYEPALGVVHADGNATTYLYFQSASEKSVKGGTEYIFNLKDNKYPVYVSLHYVAYPKENVIRQWTEIRHEEKRSVRMRQYASAMLYLDRSKYYLTQFSSDWAKEAQQATQQLLAGKKVIDTKLGTRANMFMQPLFEVGLDEPANEHRGTVLLGTLGWTGNFRFTFEIDNSGILRVISGINPYASEYELQPKTTFKTPEFIFTLSTNGVGEGSRNLHDWARQYQLHKGQEPRMSLLNNWENTYFSFDQTKLAALMKEAKTLGVDLFLLDDGWFANKYPRNDDRAGLGDWEVNRSKLPGGVPALVKAAKEAGVKFGIWIEPEMVNPKSELFEQHPDWAFTLPNRETYYYRNQLVLDLSNPKVQDHVFGVVDRIMSENPDVAFFKWDCNSPITNIFSHYTKNQDNLYVDYVRGLYKVCERVRAKYPDVTLMLCSGGGGRNDYEALKYFSEFWCSDDTDPVERLYIQWGFSQFYPVKAMCAHVTDWNKRTSVKFRTDVASMCKLGFDIGLQHLSADELAFCQGAVKNWNRLQATIMDGAQYRLVSPYEGNHMAVNYVDEAKRKAVLFSYDIHPRYEEKLVTVKLQGLDPAKRYRVTEINLMPGAKSSLPENGGLYSGDFLMNVGLHAFTSGDMHSRMIELTAE
uniref:Alpha-galactosidase n=1 Tax=Prevotella sp. GTC17262 TaxID=3236797 RepID=A0AB33JTW5_9BACT